MADSEIVITLSGPKVDSRLVSFTIRSLRAALDEIERSITNEAPQAIWETEDSEVRIVASANGVSADTLAQIQHDFLDGFAAAAGRPTPWPATVTPAARRAIGELVRQANELDAITAGGMGAPSHLVTREELAQLPVQRAVERTYSEYTSIDGKLDLISVRGTPRFVIQDFASTKRVNCRFNDEIIDRVKEALGKRVVLEGMVKFRADGTPMSIARVDSIWTRPEPVRDIDALIGSKPDFTGGDDAEDFVRRRRRGGT